MVYLLDLVVPLPCRVKGEALASCAEGGAPSHAGWRRAATAFPRRGRLRHRAVQEHTRASWSQESAVFREGCLDRDTGSQALGYYCLVFPLDPWGRLATVWRGYVGLGHRDLRRGNAKGRRVCPRGWRAQGPHDFYHCSDKKAVGRKVFYVT